MFKKLIGLVLILVIFFLAIKALVLLPTFTNLIIGDNKSPFQIGTDYVNQVNQVYPTYNTNAQYRYDNSTDSRYVGRITLEKIDGKLILSVESSNVAPNQKLNIWLTNNSQVTNQTEYIDFGTLYKDGSIRQYVVDMKGGDISFDKYKYILLVDEKYNVYKIINLN